jgi:hypothetical protein
MESAPVQLWTLIANIALTFTFIIGLVFGIAQIKSAARDRRERLTLEALRNFQTREFAELIRFIITTEEFPTTREGRNRLPPDETAMYIQFAQQMEGLGLLVAEKYIDLDLVDKTLGSFVMTSWQKYEPLFTDMRSDDPFLGEYFQWLAERIEEHTQAHPREPFYKNEVINRR